MHAPSTGPPNRKVEINFTICVFQFHNGETHETGANRKVGIREENITSDLSPRIPTLRFALVSLISLL